MEGQAKSDCGGANVIPDIRAKAIKPEARA